MPARWSLAPIREYLHISILIHKGVLIGQIRTQKSGITKSAGGTKIVTATVQIIKKEYPVKFAAGKILSNGLGVIGIEIGCDRIIIYFNDGSGYFYTHNSAGTFNIEHMKKLAKAGSVLNSFMKTTIKNVIKEKYDDK